MLQYENLDDIMTRGGVFFPLKHLSSKQSPYSQYLEIQFMIPADEVFCIKLHEFSAQYHDLGYMSLDH